MDKNKWFPDSLNPLRVEPDGTWQHLGLTMHYIRYAFALQYVNDRTVLDASSGVCYGSSLISMRAKQVVCANISQEELDYGKENFKFYCPTTFIRTDLNTEFPKQPFDVIVSFETIEHLFNPKYFLNEVRNHLTPNGLFIFSVPKTDKHRTHRQEFLWFETVHSLIQPYFKNQINWYYQLGNELLSEKPTDSFKVRHWIGVVYK